MSALPRYFPGQFATYHGLTVTIVEVDAEQASVYVMAPPTDYQGARALTVPLSSLALLPPYEVAGIGTVEAHEGDTYCVRVPGGALHGYRSAGGTPSEALAAAEIAAAIANPPAFPAARHRVLKDTLWMRIKAAGKQAEAVAAISSLPLSQRLDWDSQSWFWSDNDAIRLVCESLGVDPAEALAVDPLAP